MHFLPLCEALTPLRLHVRWGWGPYPKIAHAYISPAGSAYCAATYSNKITPGQRVEYCELDESKSSKGFLELIYLYNRVLYTQTIARRSEHQIPPIPAVSVSKGYAVGKLFGLQCRSEGPNNRELPPQVVIRDFCLLIQHDFPGKIIYTRNSNSQLANLATTATLECFKP